jgi:hypothetical protein
MDRPQVRRRYARTESIPDPVAAACEVNRLDAFTEPAVEFAKEFLLFEAVNLTLLAYIKSEMLAAQPCPVEAPRGEENGFRATTPFDGIVLPILSGTRPWHSNCNIRNPVPASADMGVNDSVTGPSAEQRRRSFFRRSPIGQCLLTCCFFHHFPDLQPIRARALV